MGLRQIAEQDLSAILSDSFGFSWNIRLTDPLGVSKIVTGFSNDIAQVIDPDTGLFITGRSASVAFNMALLKSSGFYSLPVSVADTSKKPWIVDFDDINGSAHKFKVIESQPDRTLGMIVCLLSIYRV